MHIGPEQLDALQELLNIGVGHATNTLNQMLGKPIRLHIPFIHFGTVEELSKELALENEPVLASIQLPFQGSFAGSSAASTVEPFQQAQPGRAARASR